MLSSNCLEAVIKFKYWLNRLFQCAVLNMQCVLSSVKCAAFRTPSAVCSVQDPQCSVQCAVYKVQCAVCRTPSAVWLTNTCWPTALPPARPAGRDRRERL